ncbi:MAG: DNA-directed RNA polymerase subunit beta [Bacillota bacterium]
MVAKEKGKVASREEVKKAKKVQKVQKTNEQNDKIRIRIRLIPIWVRVLLVLIFMVGSTLIGLVVGYGIIGSGNPGDALNKSTWQHIIDLVEKE